MADNSNFEGPLDRLRRQSTMSPSQSSMLQQHQQQQQQQGQQPGYMFPSMESVHHHQQQPYPQHTDSPVYAPMQNNFTNFTSQPESNGFPPTQLPHQDSQQFAPTQSPMPTPSQQQHAPYELPMSPSVGTPAENRTASLLQLLKFSQAGPPSQSSTPAPEQLPLSQPTVGQAEPPRPVVNSPPPPSTSAPAAHNRAISAQDLVDTLLNRHRTDSPAPKENTPPARSPILQRSSSEAPQRDNSQVNPQDLVFQLLGRPKPAQDESSATPLPDSQKSPVQQSSAMPPPPALGSPAPQSPAEGPSTGGNAPNKSLFTYVNPFEQLHATSPRNRTPKSGTPGPQGRSSALGHEIKAENIPLPFTPPPGLGAMQEPPATIEAEAAKDAATINQVKAKERMLMEQLGHHLSGDYSHSHRSAEAPVAEELPLQEYTEDVPATHEPEQPSENTPPETDDKTVESSDSVREVPLPEKEEGASAHEAEDADGYDSSTEDGTIDVYNFPMKPFSSITIIPDAMKRPCYPSSKVGDIVRMSRTFDQLDRNLIAASNSYIAYSVSKTNNRGGIRVIRQYDGKDRVILKDNPDRTFNLVIAKGERILGTGVSGAVIWADLTNDFDSEGWDSLFVFPPSEEQGQSNGVLKSRARKTSRLLDVFAIGRGKTISIIYAPAAKAYAQGKNNEVASKNYLADHARIIDTGKASKDFAFSDDDSVIISIDKAGKLKFWDVQELLNFSDNEAYNPVRAQFTPQPPTSLSTPMMVFSAVASGEPYRATSVMFLDKYRPYHKCMALRYVIVGMKQNHTLQLWDLALGRPVQEINFPQQSDTDALCSVVYHPMSGIIVVGNPTRNSIYFIHLSAPKYNLTALSQADYIRALANKDPSIPKPDATAILSGLREYSYASIGQLMSLDILDVESEPSDENSPLFELYVAHSKGMTTLSVFKEDLGWDQDNRVKNPISAVEIGACKMSSLPTPPHPEKEHHEKTEVSDAQSLKPKSEKSGKSRSVSPRPADKVETAEEKATAASNAAKKKKKEKASTPVPVSPEQAELGTDEPKTKESPAANGKAKAQPSPPAGPSGSELDVYITADQLDREVRRLEKNLSAEFNNTFHRELDVLYGKIDEDRRTQQAAGDAKHDAVLRIISSTLTDNVEAVISRIVLQNIQTHVVPAVADVAAISVERLLADSLTRTLGVALPNELRQIVPDAVNRTIGSPEFQDRVAASLNRPLTQSIERELSHSLHNNIIPAFQKLAFETTREAITETERKHNETIARFEQLRYQDSQKIDQLMGTVKTLSDNMNTLVKQQADFQDQVRQAQDDYFAGQSPSTAPTPKGQHQQQQQQGYHPQQHPHQQPQPTPYHPQQHHGHQAHHQVQAKTPAQLEAEDIENLLKSGKYEDGTIKWLQSKERQAELFDEVMVHYRYDFLPNLSQLVLLSVSAAVSVKFEHKVAERLSWLEGVLNVLDPMDPEIHEICHRIMVVVVQRLEQLYMATATVNPQDAILRKITNIARRARDLSNMSARH